MRSRIDSSGVITTIAGTGTGGYNGDGGAATSAQLNGPKGVAIDGSGRVLIADTLNSRIRRIETNGTISTVTGDGSAFFSGDTGDAASATVNAPEGVAVDSTGRILIADSGNVRIRRIETDNKIYTIAGGGAGGSGDGGAAVDALLAAPIRVVPLQAGGFLLLETDYLAGYGTARIRRVDARNTWARIEALLRNRIFVREHAYARALWRGGAEVIFPAGTYWLRRFAGVPVAEARAQD